MQNINLIPQNERIQQTKVKLVKLSTILALFVFLAIAAYGGFLFYSDLQVKEEIKQRNGQIALMRDSITKLSDIEVNARNLFKKTSTLDKIFTDRIYYSRLITQFNESVPEGVTVDSFTLGQDLTISISGAATNYNLVQDFTNRLLEKELFTQVSLNSVSLDNSNKNVTFFLVVTYNGELLND